jgi:hypothetical protein
MHSPKFPLKIDDLRKVINVGRLKTIWKAKVREAMRSQPIPDPLENLDFHVRLNSNCEAIEAEVCSASYIPRPPNRFLSEKSKGLCRQLVIPSVKDALILQTLSDALWVEIRLKAPTKKSFYSPADHGFSKAIKGHAAEYGSFAAWLAFQKTVFGFTATKKYLVVTDIANYYDFISYEHLRNILADLSLAKEHALDLLIYSLSCMLWQPDYMPRVPVGLPQMNLDAPRLLAHCFLFEIDKFLDSVSSADFARFMDDIDIGIDSISEAREILKNLDLALQTRQIRLNSGKTRILTEAEARAHFKIRENVLLNSLAERIALKKSKTSLFNERRKIEIGLRTGMRKGTFTTGNGDKILKRLLNLARETSADLTKEHFLKIFEDWPSVRSVALNWWQHQPAPVMKLHLITELAQDGFLVDDAARMDIATALVAARLPDTAYVRNHIKQILLGMNSDSVWSLYAQIWIASKYRSSDELMSLVESKVSVWSNHERLSRLVAGTLPRFLGLSSLSKFRAILHQTNNIGVLSVLQFHDDLSTTTSGYTSVGGFIRAPNKSLPNRISHSKFLMLLSALHNPTIAPTAAAHLKSIHSVALSDNFYKPLVP